MEEYTQLSMYDNVPIRMNDSTKCIDHHKVYSNYHRDKKFPWICAICGKEGVDPSLPLPHTEYEELRVNFKRVWGT